MKTTMQKHSARSLNERSSHYHYFTFFSQNGNQPLQIEKKRALQYAFDQKKKKKKSYKRDKKKAKKAEYSWRIEESWKPTRSTVY